MWLSELKKTKYIIIGILCFGFLLRFGFFLRNPNFNYTQLNHKLLPSEISYFEGGSGNDSQEYKSLALNMLKHHRFSWDSEPVTFRTPGYPFFIASIYFLFGIKDWIVMVLQILLSTASIYLIYLIGKNIGNELGGIIGASLFSIDFPSILFSSLLMSETIFVFFILIGTLLFLKNMYSGTVTPVCDTSNEAQPRVPVSGFIFGVSALIRPIALYIFVPLFLLMLGKRICLWHKNARKALLFLFLFFLPIVPWMARNFKVYHSPLLTSNHGFNLLFLHAALVESEEHHISIEEAQHKFSKELRAGTRARAWSNPLKLASLAQKIGIRRIIKSPLRYAFIHLKGWVWVLLSTKSDDIVIRCSGTDIAQSRLLTDVPRRWRGASTITIFLFAGIEVTVVVCSTILAIISLIRSPRLPNLLFFLIALYFFILAGPLGESRFRLPLIPFIYLLGSQNGWKWLFSARAGCASGTAIAQNDREEDG